MISGSAAPYPRILAFQLKRLGDLVLTAPAIASLREKFPSGHITLAAYGPAAGLVPLIPHVDAVIVFAPGRAWSPWQQLLTGSFDLVYDFTGNDRSAFATALSRAPERLGFAFVRKSGLRRLAYSRFVDSPVRELHTADHYSALVGASGGSPLSRPPLFLPASAENGAEKVLRPHVPSGKYVLIHPGSARPEKYWEPERWAKVISSLREVHSLDCVLTGGTDDFEREQIRQIGASCKAPFVNLAGEIDLLTLAGLAHGARLVVSCDTAVVHLAAAFATPQVALFGPTNPFHWRPRHSRAVVLSAASPDAPLIEFTPRMQGAPMQQISTRLVIRAIDALLAAPDERRALL